MPKETLQDIRDEQSVAERRARLLVLASYEKTAKQYATNRKGVITSIEQQMAKLETSLANAKNNLVEIEANVTEYVAELEDIAAKDVITQADVTTVGTGLVDVSLTAKEKENRAKVPNVRTVYEDMNARHKRVNPHYVDYGYGLPR